MFSHISLQHKKLFHSINDQTEVVNCYFPKMTYLFRSIKAETIYLISFTTTQNEVKTPKNSNINHEMVSHTFPLFQFSHKKCVFVFCCALAYTTTFVIVEYHFYGVSYISLCYLFHFYCEMELNVLFIILSVELLSLHYLLLVKKVYQSRI